LADFNGKLLYDWLPTNKRFGEYLGVHIVSPFLNENVISFATHIPPNLKFDVSSNVGKILLRDILSRRGIHIASDKKGFGMNLLTLWNKHAKKIAEEYLLSDSILVVEGIIKREWLKKAFRIIESSKSIRYISKMLMLIACEIWLRKVAKLM
jgi:asparagine synthase (glutamine-hydrolysing)